MCQLYSTLYILILTSSCLNPNANEFLENRGILAVTIVIFIQRLLLVGWFFYCFLQFHQIRSQGTNLLFFLVFFSYYTCLLLMNRTYKYFRWKQLVSSLAENPHHSFFNKESWTYFIFFWLLIKVVVSQSDWPTYRYKTQSPSYEEQSFIMLMPGHLWS